MKILTRNLICSIFWSFATMASPLTFERTQEPKPLVIRLSDGRIVPEGSGVICSDDCVEAAAISLPDSSSRRWLIMIPIGTAIIACAILCRGGDTSIGRPPVTELPPDTPTTPVPEMPTALFVALGILGLYRMRK